MNSCIISVFALLLTVASRAIAFDSLNVSRVGELTLGWDDPRALRVAGNYAYVATLSTGVKVIDVSDPDNPIEVGSVALPGHAYGLDLCAGVLCVGMAQDGIAIVDISNPSASLLLAVIESYTGDVGAYGGSNFACASHYLYVASPPDLGFAIYDLSPPTRPRLVRRSTNWYIGQSLTTNGSLLVSSVSGGLSCWSLDSLENPEYFGWTRFFGEYNLPHFHDVVLVSDSLCLAWGNYIALVDFSDPFEPVIRDTLPGNIHGGVRADVASGIAYVCNLGALSMLDFSDPDNLQWIHNFGSAINSIDIGFSGDMSEAFTVTEWDSQGFHVYDFTNPFEPELRAAAGTYAPLSDVAVAGDFAYATDPFRGLHIIDLSNPVSPLLAATVPVASGWHVYADSELVFVAANDSLLKIFDVSNPVSPAPLAEIAMPYNAWSMDLIERRDSLLFTLGAGHLMVYDISSPAAPVFVGEPLFPGIDWEWSGVRGFALYDTFAIVCSIQDLGIYSITSGILSPTEIYSHAIIDEYSGYCSNIKVDSSNLYIVADYSLRRYDWSERSSISWVDYTLYLDVYFDYLLFGESVCALDRTLWVFDRTNLWERPPWGFFRHNTEQGNLATYDQYLCAVGTSVLTIYSLDMLEANDRLTPEVPSGVSLSVFPNPFNSETSIAFNLSAAGPTSISLFDVTGRLVTTLFDEFAMAGEHRVLLDSRNMASGSYFVKLRHPGTQETIRVTLLK